MNRSIAIRELFLDNGLPEDIIKYILECERKISFKEQIYEWTHLPMIVKTEKCKRFFYEDYNDRFLMEIQDVQGRFDVLKENLEIVKIIKRNNHSYGNSLRY
jgi:hypothetical protein